MLQCSGSIQFLNFASLRLKVIGFLTLFLFSVSGLSSPCDLARRQFEKRFEKLQSRTFNDFGEIITNPENFPVWNTGFGPHKNEVIYLLHGFIGTPFEMRSTAQKLVSSGYTVVLDLLPGHGVSADVANHFTKADLKTHVFANIDALSSCADQIHLVGFSTGATLVHHYLQFHSSPKIKSASLISPYYRPTIIFGDLLSGGSAVFFSKISVDFVYAVSRFPDIKVAFLDPDHYHNDIPLEMANEINSLGEDTFLTKAEINTPVLVLTSSLDKIASPATTHLKIALEFSKIKLLHFNALNLAPHHLMATPVSPVATQVHQAIFDFIN